MAVKRPLNHSGLPQECLVSVIQKQIRAVAGRDFYREA